MKKKKKTIQVIIFNNCSMSLPERTVRTDAGDPTSETKQLSSHSVTGANPNVEPTTIKTVTLFHKRLGLFQD